MVRVIGIDPGSGSWDIFGLEGDSIFLDVSIPSRKVLEEPKLLIDILEKHKPVDMILAPSGHGIPLKPLESITDDDISKANLRRTSDPNVMGIAKVLFMLRDAGVPGYTVPGVKQLKSVKDQYKFNKIDMGTADKVCAAAAAIVDQSTLLDIPLDRTGFILLEVGAGFTATLAVEGGKIIDGIGGSLGCMGIRACGGLDAELAYLLRKISKKVIYTGGLADIVGYPDLSLQEIMLMANKDAKISDAVDGFIHDIMKDIAALIPSFSSPGAIREILLSGRGSSKVLLALEEQLPKISPSPARIVRNIARISKVAAQGAAFIARGLAGESFYKDLVEIMGLAKSNHDLLGDIYIGELSF
ncbi:MAG: DUF1464 family protein [Promethearchaeota archaeon]